MDDIVNSINTANNVLQNILQNSQNQKATDKAYQFQRDMAFNQNLMQQLSQANANNYNSIGMIMQRYQSAGLNPYAAIQNGEHGSASPLSGASVSAPTAIPYTPLDNVPLLQLERQQIQDDRNFQLELLKSTRDDKELQNRLIDSLFNRQEVERMNSHKVDYDNAIINQKEQEMANDLFKFDQLTQQFYDKLNQEDRQFVSKLRQDFVLHSQNLKETMRANNLVDSSKRADRTQRYEMQQMEHEHALGVLEKRAHQAQDEQERQFWLNLMSLFTIKSVVGNGGHTPVKGFGR